MRKKILILQSILLLIAVFASNGCSIGVKDEPLPLSQENIEKYASAVEEATKKIDPSAGTAVDRLIKAYKEPMEKKLGYSFDKTLSAYVTNAATFSSMSPEAIALKKNIMFPVLLEISVNMDEALKKGLISQPTYEEIRKLD